MDHAARIAKKVTKRNEISALCDAYLHTDARIAAQPCASGTVIYFCRLNDFMDTNERWPDEAEDVNPRNDASETMSILHA